MQLRVSSSVTIYILIIFYSNSALGKNAKGYPCVSLNNTAGTCRQLKYCWVSYENPQPPVSFCRGKFGNNVLVCCPDERPLRPIEQKCSDYGNMIQNFKSSPPPNLILGDEKDSSKQYPHLVKVFQGPRNHLKWLCSGTIITQRYVLSSAACIESPTGWATHIGSGSTFLIPVKKRIHYNNYNQSNLFHDLGLLYLKKDIQFDLNIRPACVNIKMDFEDDEETEITASEWNHQQNSVSVVDHETCNKHFVVREILETEQICVRLDNNCNFRTGSALQIKHPHVDQMYSIVGVLTFRKDCLKGRSIVAYTRVSQFASWIESMAFS